MSRNNRNDRSPRGAAASIPRQMLLEIRPSSSPDPYGVTLAHGPVAGEVPLSGDLGDQQAVERTLDWVDV